MRIPIVGVMGSGVDEYVSLAEPLGELIARLGFHLLTGGGGGTMTSVARAFCSVSPRAGLSIGIVPMATSGDGFTPLPGYPNQFVEVCIKPPLSDLSRSAPDGLNRNWVNVLTNDVVVALPGSHGTRQEVDLALRWGKPILLFGSAAGFEGFPDAERTEILDAVESFLRNQLSS